MLKNWQSHQDYLNFLHEAKIHFDSSQRVRLAGANGAVRWPAAKWMPARAGINAPNPHTGGASIQNLTGMRAFIPRLPGARGNIKKFIKTAHPVNG